MFSFILMKVEQQRLCKNYIHNQAFIRIWWWDLMFGDRIIKTDSEFSKKVMQSILYLVSIYNFYAIMHP